jgi:hypothetical protein
MVIHLYLPSSKFCIRFNQLLILKPYISFSYSHTDIYDHYLSSDDEGGERHEYHEEEEDEDELNPFNQTNEEEEDIIIEDVSSHDIWKGKKKQLLHNFDSRHTNPRFSCN